MMGTKGHIAVSGLVIIAVAAVALAAAFAFRGEDIDDTPAAAVSAPQDGSAETTKEVAIKQSDIGATTQASPLIEPDLDFVREMQRAGVRPIGWTTDFSLHSVEYKEIRSGGVPRDGIPPLDDPQFTAAGLASEWLDDREPVIALEINGVAKAYPLQVLIWHEIANDVVGGVPVTVTFCPLCNSALVFERTLDGVVHDFGVSGNLRKSDLIMWDRQTET
jgi:hypothetical protein